MSVFKAYDIRGKVPGEIDGKIAKKIGKAFVNFVGCKNVVIGRDMRSSSDELEESLIEGILEQGVDVVTIGLCTTPMMYYTVAKFDYDAGIMITASHNPKEYNGFKMVREAAIPLTWEKGISQIRDMVKKNKFPKNEVKGSMQQRSEILDDYVMNEMSGTDVKKLKKCKIVVDYGNGMGALVGKKFFSHLDVELTELFQDLDGNFPNHEANPLKEENLEDIKKAIKKNKADFGVAFDGDADRVFFIDEKGKTVTCDKLTALIAKAMLKKQPGAKILYDLRSSKIVPETIENNGGWPVISRVGHSYIKAKMREEDAIFAGELSGHFYVRDNFFFESPFYIILRMMEILAGENKSFSGLIQPLNKYHATGEINSIVKDKDKKMNEIEKVYSDAKKVFFLDGITIEYDDWWFNVRPSNTEPYLRLNLEANTKKLMEKKRDEVLKLINK